MRTIMGKTICFGAALATIGVLASPPARAATYNYIGNTLSTGGHIEATVDLNCASTCSGSYYYYGTGLTSFSLSAFDNLGSLIFSINSNEAPYQASYLDYVKIDASGEFSEWILLRTVYPIPRYIYTTFNHPVFATGDVYAFGPNVANASFDYADPKVYGSPFQNVGSGVWSASAAAPAVPIPAALPLLAAGLAAMGFHGWRRRKAAVGG